MGGIIINGRRETISELNMVPFYDFIEEPKLGLDPSEDMRDRKTGWVRSVIAHTTKGVWPMKVIGGAGPDTNLEDRIARLWSTDDRHAGAHLSVDWDGSICCHADLLTKATYHATICNEVSIGIEIFQGGKPDSAVYDEQLQVTATLIDWLTARFGIQRQMPLMSQYKQLDRIADKKGENFVGVYGHRHVGNRGRGDPGDYIFLALASRGYEVYDLDKKEDINVWKQRQAELSDLLNLPMKIDGIPGPKTVEALSLADYRWGIWAAGKRPAGSGSWGRQ